MVVVMRVCLEVASVAKCKYETGKKVAVCVLLWTGPAEGEYSGQLGGGYPGTCWSSAGE